MEMSDCLLAERRHRYNHNISEKRRTGFPKLGHYDTWLIDKLQLLVDLNHNLLLYPTWANTADYAPTKERFGTVPIHSKELGEAFNTIKLEPGVANKFTADQRYLSTRMGTKAPVLPVHGEKEHKLFRELILSSRYKDDVDMDNMAVEWCKYVDGIDIFPKLPVYLRKHLRKWQHNQRVRESVGKAASGEEMLAQINKETSNAFHLPVPASAPAVPPPAPTTSAATTTTTTTTITAAPTTTPTLLPSANADIPSEALMVMGEGQVSTSPAMPLPQFFHSQHPAMAQSICPLVSEEPILVGGVNVNSTLQVLGPTNKRHRGQRAKDKSPRAHRKCQKCVKDGRSVEVAEACVGRGPLGVCPYLKCNYCLTERGEDAASTCVGRAPKGVCPYLSQSDGGDA